MFITPDTNYEDKEASKWKNLSDVTHVYFQNRKKKKFSSQGEGSQWINWGDGTLGFKLFTTKGDSLH